MFFFSIKPIVVVPDSLSFYSNSKKEMLPLLGVIRFSTGSRGGKGHAVCPSPGVTGKHIPPRDIIPMGIDSLRNCSKFTPRYIFA